MSRGVQLVLLHEDRQQRVFLRRFFIEMGWSDREIRSDGLDSSGGSGEQYVRERFPTQLNAYRKSKNHVKSVLVVMIDGDNVGPEARVEQLLEECTKQGVDHPDPKEGIAIFIPTWNIETWLWYLEGNSVDETRKNYPRLKRERECKKHAERLAEACRKDQLSEPVPPSMLKACREYNSRIAPLL